MLRTTRAVRLVAGLVTLAVTFVGLRGLVRRLNAALWHYLQLRRLERLEKALAAEHGPITLEAWARAERIVWPR